MNSFVLLRNRYVQGVPANQEASRSRLSREMGIHCDLQPSPAALPSRSPADPDPDREITKLPISINTSIVSHARVYNSGKFPAAGGRVALPWLVVKIPKQRPRPVPSQTTNRSVVHTVSPHGPQTLPPPTTTTSKLHSVACLTRPVISRAGAQRGVVSKHRTPCAWPSGSHAHAHTPSVRCLKHRPEGETAVQSESRPHVQTA